MVKGKGKGDGPTRPGKSAGHHVPTLGRHLSQKTSESINPVHPSNCQLGEPITVGGI